jgi:hypothetical protein
MALADMEESQGAVFTAAPEQSGFAYCVHVHVSED